MGPQSAQEPRGGPIAIRLALRTVSESNARGRGWWAKARRTKHLRGVARLGVLPRIAWAGAREWPGWVVTLVRVAPSSGLDDDNLRGALKAVRDGVADALGLKSDRDPRIQWEYGQRRGPYAVEVGIARAANAAADVLQTPEVRR